MLKCVFSLFFDLVYDEYATVLTSGHDAIPHIDETEINDKSYRRYEAKNSTTTLKFKVT